jgi:hypothetical protein
MNTLLYTLNPDVLILTEHGLKRETMLSTRLIGYSLITEFSRKYHLKGGVAIFVREHLKNCCEALMVQQFSIELVCEVAAIKLRMGKTTFSIVGIYRTQNNLEIGLEVMYEVLESIPAHKNSVILMGDINIDSLNKKHDYTLLMETLTSHNIYRLTLPPTRITPTSRTSIDCVCCNIPQDNIGVEVIETSISDHTAQLCTVGHTSTSTPSNIISERRNLGEENLMTLKELLGQQDWSEVYKINEPNEAYNRFSHILLTSLNQACPKRKSRQRRKKKKFTLNDPTAQQLKKNFIEAQHTYNTTGREEHKRTATLLKKEYDLQLRLLRKQDTASTISKAENKAKSIWDVINSERKPKEDSTALTHLNINGNIISKPLQMADYLNNFFVNVAEETILTNRPNINQSAVPMIHENAPNLALSPTDTEEMSKIISALKPKTSSGYDEISNRLLKFCEDELTEPLVYIANLSFSSGTFPNALKLSKIYPKHKEGCKTQPSNYRPISLIPTISKVFEKLVLSRLLKHLTSNQLLTQYQHGFIPGKSTTTALINLIEFLIDQQEEGNACTAILLDYSKAFDCLDHEHLLEKMSALGVQGTAKAWFRSFITGRSQIVEIRHNNDGKVEQVRSCPKKIIRGVPQGSVLGPVLYILFTNDLPKFLEDYTNCLMYADDTVLLLGRKTIEQLEIDAYIALSMATQYCHNNELVINQKKTKQLVLGRNREEAARIPELEEVKYTKYLGVTVDEDLSWTQHINSLCSKLSTGLYVLQRMKSISDTNTTKIAYYALFESHIRYGIAVWGGTTITNLQRVLMKQKRAIRILGNLQPRESCRESFKKLNILTVISLYILEVVSYIHIKAPEAVRSGAQIHQYNTRHATNYCLPVHHLSSTEKKPSYIGAKMWNSLPEELKRMDKQHFYRCLKNWLQERPFYSLAEFYDWKTLPQI